MDLAKIKEIIQRKPRIFLLISVGYFIALAGVKWQIHPTVGTALFLLGSLIGVYFLDVAEVFFRLNPSPFRSVVFAAAFVGVSLFVITSSGSMVASGLVLSLYLSLILWLIGEWQIQKNITSWFRMIAGSVSVPVQRRILIGFIIFFVVETFLFMR